MRRLLILSAVGLTACGGGGTSTRPSPTPSPITPVTLSGQLRATNSGQPIAGATIQVPSGSATTNADGRFTLSVLPAAAIHARITGPLVDREVNLQARKGREVAIEGFTEGPTFDLAYYRQIARQGFDGTSGLRALRRWTQNPNLYVRTVDNTNRAMQAELVQRAIDTARFIVPFVTGGSLAVGTVEQGTGTREGQQGWLTVKWNAQDSSQCGRATVGLSGGYAEFDYDTFGCACGALLVNNALYLMTSPAVIAHELGHAMGLYHTDSDNELMSPGARGRHRAYPACLSLEQPASRERQYARYLYARPVGNTDPDIDAIGTVLLQPVTVH